MGGRGRGWEGSQKDKQHFFPTYSRVPANAPVPSVTGAIRQVALQDTGRSATDMQSALDHARKTEARVPRRHGAYSTWALFETQAKANFQTEWRRFFADLERIEQEALAGPQNRIQGSTVFYQCEDSKTLDGVLQRSLGASLTHQPAEQVVTEPTVVSDPAGPQNAGQRDLATSKMLVRSPCRTCSSDVGGKIASSTTSVLALKPLGGAARPPVPAEPPETGTPSGSGLAGATIQDDDQDVDDEMD
ncbi:hypothetical protein AK812_SmicGene34055 [Symbiodinium microadriaticum]|uniref:Uncharacterized protein n=1 Tax=Symbiodinium microadriaticum TaxID=2951 RepID=A0A1Q9CQ09_SYMMI|nr:hypothetical protein AK812_SmicGene34055 [Symbiodinium microadriaticum]